MSYELIESIESRQWDENAVTFFYKLKGEGDNISNDVTARNLVLSSTAATYQSMVRQSPRIEPVYLDTVTDKAIWAVEVRYALGEMATGESSFSFDTTGGTQHITQSISTVNRYAASGSAPNFQGAIGYNGESVEGCDIITPEYRFTETHYIAAASVDGSYKASLFALTGQVNNASFKGLAAGECLFLGASGSLRDSGEDWEITFNFAASPNRTGLTVGSITGIAKKGWEYIWVEYGEDESNNRLVKVPVSVHVEQVYEEGDFSGLGIGT